MWTGSVFIAQLHSTPRTTASHIVSEDHYRERPCNVIFTRHGYGIKTLPHTMSLRKYDTVLPTGFFTLLSAIRVRLYAQLRTQYTWCDPVFAGGSGRSGRKIRHMHVIFDTLTMPFTSHLDNVHAQYMYATRSASVTGVLYRIRRIRSIPDQNKFRCK